MANFIGLDKGYPVLPTYNSSAAAGVLAFRCVKYSVSSSIGYIDIQAVNTAGNLVLGIVQENIDATKVATGKAIANVRIGGISKVLVTTGTSIVLGSRVMASTGGGVILATGATAQLTGFVVGMSVPGGTVAANDLIDVYLTPAVQFGA